MNATWAAIAVGAFCNIAALVYGYGRMTASIDEMERRMDRVQMDVREVRSLLMSSMRGN